MECLAKVMAGSMKE